MDVHSQKMKDYTGYSLDHLEIDPSKTPKIIHQTWKNTQVPRKLQKYVTSCKEANTEFIYKLWTDEDLEDVISRYFPQYLQKYKNFKENIERVDFARYAILYVYGGIYADLDIQCFKTFTDLCELNKIVLGNEPIEHREVHYNNRNLVVCNALMISPPNQEFWLVLMEFIVKNYKSWKNPVWNTGPMALTKLHDHNPEVYNFILILPACYFYGQSDRFTNKTQLGVPHVSKECDFYDEMPYTVHRWSHTWIPGEFQDDPEEIDSPEPPKKDYTVFYVILLLIIICVLGLATRKYIN